MDTILRKPKSFISEESLSMPLKVRWCIVSCIKLCVVTLKAGIKDFLLLGYQNNLKVLYSQVATPSSLKKTRYIPSVPERILDAPELRNDFCKYL